MMVDSRGKNSKTLTFVTIAFIVVIVKFVLAGLVIPVLGTVPVMGGGEFAAAIGAVLGIWTAREWKDKEPLGKS